MRKGAYTLALLGLTGCYALENNPSERIVPARPVSGIVYDTVVGSVEGAWAAVQIPFEDVGLKKQTIPEPLQRVSDNPYASTANIPCATIRKEISELDTLLGADICTADNPTGLPVSRKGEYVERGAKTAQEHAVDMVRSKVNVIPFRGIVRHISGAEKNSKAYERAVEAGKLRRAFLKGIAANKGAECLNPLAPAPVTHPAVPPSPIEVNMETLQK